ncbi:hypothetical protein J5N97_022058 [Dioscorea zingiberensis]|uniref:Uncharacterized protein n=1 Tax=Dioscorea zingiberensis TaxID=325984 RepID=A0A9D5HA77_9LILI|nr:hypothetical protein J5N97_022058 [Dioscorea zingiberensis]
MEPLPEIYSLTGLQIGDIQSYVSRAFLYFTTGSNKLLILVDNRPWLLNQHSRSARLWQLMVIKYRMSPFANTRTRGKATNIGNETERNGCCSSNHVNPQKSGRWLPVIDSLKRREKYLFSVMDLSKALHGFLVFEVAWKDVCGINYLNELQTDTSLALEVKSMKKWEFYTPDQALSCLSVWFSGSISEIQSLKSNLRKLSDPDSHHWHDDSPSKEILSEDESLDVQESLHETDEQCTDSLSLGNYEAAHHNNMNTNGSEKTSKEYQEMEGESDIAPTDYSHKLLLFRFNDSLLPFKLKQIIISEVRLLTLLESGLPSWVIFFQSYPLFCQFYRPWMRHLARTLYILISLVTVIIGFYDLYKNVPLLKVTASRICGPVDQYWQQLQDHFLHHSLKLQDSSLLSGRHLLYSYICTIAIPVYPLLAYLSKAKQGANEISVWRGLWNDLFSQVFRASGSIIKGFLAFFGTCNRHRLSTSNQIRAFFLRLAHFVHLAPRTCHCKQRLQIEHCIPEEHTQCDHCE